MDQLDFAKQIGGNGPRCECSAISFLGTTVSHFYVQRTLRTNDSDLTLDLHVGPERR